MRLGIDMDGVICRFNDGWTAIHRAEFGSAVEAAHIVGWDGLHTLGGFADMDEFWSWAGPQDHRPSVFRHLEPYEGAVETLHRLADDGHDLVIISAKPPWAVPDSLFWLADQAIRVAAVHFVEDKTTVACDLYIDDADHNLSDLWAAHRDAIVLRMVRPWNSPADGVLDVTTWDEVYALVTSLSPGAGPGFSSMS